MDDGLTEEQRKWLVDRRGGCSCHVHPPCSACCNPITDDERDIMNEEMDKEIEG